MAKKRRIFNSDLIRKAYEFLGEHSGEQFPLESDTSVLPYVEQQKLFLESLHSHNSGWICLPRKKVFRKEEDMYYYNAAGQKRKKNPWYNHNFYELGSDIDPISKVWGNSNDSYVSANPMDGVINEQGVRVRDDAHCLGISDIHLDIDVLHALDPYDSELADKVISVVIAILMKVLPEPHIVTLSGRGLTWIYRYDHLLMNPTEEDEFGNLVHLNPEVNLHDEMYKKLIAKVQALFDPDIIEVDTKIVDHARVVRHAGTINRAAKRYAVLLVNNPDLFYAPQALYDQMRLDQVVVEEKNKKKSVSKKGTKKEKRDSKPKRLDPNTLPLVPWVFRYNAKYTIAKMEKIPDMKCLVDGTGRHQFIFVYYCFVRLLHIQPEAMDLAWKLNLRFEEPLPEDEFLRQIERVDVHEEPWHKCHSHGVYIFHESTVIDFLPITAEEARELGFANSETCMARCAANQEECGKRDREIAKLWLSGMSERRISKALQGKYAHVSLDTIKAVRRRLGLTAARDTKYEDIDFEGNKRFSRLKNRSLNKGKEERIQENGQTGILVDEKQSETNHSEKEEEPDVGPEQEEIRAAVGKNRMDVCAKVKEKKEQKTFSGLSKEQLDSLDMLLKGEDFFLSGIGGTGKSMILQKFVDSIGTDHILITAPSGKAASSIGGHTIHHALKITPRVYGPLDEVKDFSVEVFESKDILIIDEIGMVRFDLFNQIIRIVETAELQYQKHIQVICIGDFNQIPPVITNADARMLEFYWNIDPTTDCMAAFASPYWIKRGLWNPKQVFLLRQSQRHLVDPVYRHALMRVYCQDRGQDLIAYLNESVHPELAYSDEYLHICGTNRSVMEINRICIEKHKGDPSYQVCHAKNCEWQEPSGYDVDYDIPIYIGMPVITTINVGSYQNGTYGIISKIHKKSGSVTIVTDSGKKVRIHPHKFIATDAQSRDEWIKQLPIKPAYAITFHKAQGMTVDRAVIHPECWMPGQLYVGLSRVRTKKGLVLASSIKEKHIISNPAALHAYRYLQRVCA